MKSKELAFVIRAKAKKLYRAKGPIDLVIHEGATPIDGLWAQFDETDLVRSMKANAKGSAFTKIWLVDFSSERFFVVEAV